MSRSLLFVIAMLSACNHAVDEGFGELGGGGDGIDPSETAAVDSDGTTTPTSNITSGDDPPRDLGDGEASTAAADASGDPPATCGNGAIERDEDCEGDNVDGQTCMTWGFLAGELACNADCTLDTSACLSEAVCGDGLISGEEDCEVTTDETCTSLALGEGTLVCAKDCRYDASACSCRGAGEACYIDWLMPGGQSNCCPPGFKGVVQGACGAGSGTCH